VAAVWQTQILGLRFWIFAWYVILLVGSMGLVGAWAWGRRTGWRNRDEIVRGFGTILLSWHAAAAAGIALKSRCRPRGTAVFVVAFLQGGKLKPPSLRVPGRSCSPALLLTRQLGAVLAQLPRARAACLHRLSSRRIRWARKGPDRSRSAP
jgi:hypothetical protein